MVPGLFGRFHDLYRRLAINQHTPMAWLLKCHLNASYFKLHRCVCWISPRYVSFFIRWTSAFRIGREPSVAYSGVDLFGFNAFSLLYQLALKNGPTLTFFIDTRYGIYVIFFGMRLTRTSLDFDFYLLFLTSDHWSTHSDENSVKGQLVIIS